MEETQESPVDTLANKLSVIENLRDKLVHVKWSQESLRLLERVALDTMSSAQEHGINAIRDSASQLRLQIQTCMATESLPQREGREKLLYLLDELKHLLARRSNPAAVDDGSVHGADPGDELLLIGAEDLQPLADKLQHFGYRPRRIESLDSARKLLIKQSPAAMVIDTDCGGESLAAVTMVEQLRERFGLVQAPVIFVSERGDLEARMEAARVGGSGYFNKPVNVSSLAERLRESLCHKSLRGYRVLVVGEDGVACRELANVLDTKGVLSQVLLHPSQVLHSLHRFKPDLLVLDLDSIKANGALLAKAVRQHEACEGLPLLLLTSQATLSQDLVDLGNGEGDILVKPLSDQVLLAAVAYRLRKARAFLARLNHLGRRDSVTALGNRRYFLDHLKRAFEPDGSSPPNVALMLITVDNLRQMEALDVNVADEVLSQMAVRLHRIIKSQIQGQSEVARFGAAIFAVLLNTEDREMLLGLARSVQASLNRLPYVVDDARVTPQTSVGISVTSSDNDNYLTLIQRANMACIMARDAGGDHIRIHSPVDHHGDEISYQLELLQQVREAAEQQRMSLVFQPIVDLKRDGIERHEVLLRMSDGNGQELLPETVFAATQHQPLGVFLERWVVANSLGVLQKRRAVNRTSHLFINISAAILQDETFLDWLRRGLIKTGASAGELVFEVAEGVIWSRLEQWKKFANDVRGLGCSFAVEHFGAGDDSERLLEQLPMDYVKFDAQRIEAWKIQKKNFFQGLMHRCVARKISPIVTGVEDMATLQTIISGGVNYAQGYFLKRPDGDMDYVFA